MMGEIRCMGEMAKLGSVISAMDGTSQTQNVTQNGITGILGATNGSNTAQTPAPAATAAGNDNLLKDLREVVQQAQSKSAQNSSAVNSGGLTKESFEEMLKSSPAFEKGQKMLSSLENRVEEVSSTISSLGRQQEMGFSKLEKLILMQSGAGSMPEPAPARASSANEHMDAGKSSEDSTKELFIALRGHQHFLQLFDLRETNESRKVMPKDGQVVSLSKWWNSVFRLRPLMSWKHLLTTKADLPVDTVNDIDSRDSLLAFFLDNDILILVTDGTATVGA